MDWRGDSISMTGFIISARTVFNVGEIVNIVFDIVDVHEPLLALSVCAPHWSWKKPRITKHSMSRN